MLIPPIDAPKEPVSHAEQSSLLFRRKRFAQVFVLFTEPDIGFLGNQNSQAEGG